ncbi:MAG: ShlB/FhaC/HecB family hemolysin secretion/activation protein [Phenylobacterium sp.]|nr:ShlB/FhaC/HecB family hemolysin secretion/activation protein [Phenylobacterium sp.]
MNPAARTEMRAPPADLFSAPDAGPCPLAENPAALTITSVTLRGLESVPAEALAPAYAAFLNRPNGDASDLCKVRDAVANALFDRGLLVRVEIPAQTIDAGAVVLEVIEARIANVTVRGDPGPAAPALERYAEKLRGMAPFDIARVQRYILLASDVPGMQVRASVRPGSSGERGAVDLDLTVERDEEEVILNVQNLQAKATGRWGVLGRYDLNARTRYGERTTLVFYRTLQNEQWVAQGLTEARFGSEGLVVRGGLAYGESRPGGPLGGLGLKSVSVIGSMEAAYPVVRSRRKNIWAAAGVEVIDQDTRLGGAGKLINDDLRVVYARIEGDQTVYYGYRPIQLRGQVGLRQGLNIFGATDKGDRLLSRADARPSAWSLGAEGSILTLLTPTLSAYVEVSGQYADKPLAAYEEFSVGSLTVGRGYDPGYVTGDKALAATFELRAGPYQPRAGLTVSPYGFFDIAHTADRDRTGFNQTLKSVGFGVQIPVRERWMLDVGYAHPLDKSAIAARKPPGRLLVNFTARFF